MNHPPPPPYEAVKTRFMEAALPHQVTTLVHIQVKEATYPILCLVLGQGNPRRVLLSAGIHGDEPAGVITLLDAVQRGWLSPFLDRWEVTLVPCLNPTGYEAGTRENHAGVDLNRTFKRPDPPAEVAGIQSLFSHPFDLDLELHEDVDSPGFYLYQKEQGPLSSLGRRMLEAVEPVMPLNDLPEIEEMPADRGLLSRLSDPQDMAWWPMAVYAYARGCRRVFTLETATGFPMETRVQAHRSAIETALSEFDGTEIRP